MKLVIRTGFFHVLCICFFSLLYFLFQTHFQHQYKEKFETIDYILLSTTIQAGVGISQIYPTSFYGKIIMIIQQVIMLMTHIFTIYIFTM